MRRSTGKGNGKNRQDSDEENWIPQRQLIGGMLTDAGHSSEKAGEFASALQNFERPAFKDPCRALERGR